MFIEAVTVSVNYDDYLNTSLPFLSSQVDRVLVATTPTDKKTINVCKKHNVECVQTDRITKQFTMCDGNFNTPVFNKGGGLSEALSRCCFKDWILVIDADIVLPLYAREKINCMNLDCSKIYGVSRFFCENANDLKTENFLLQKTKSPCKENPVGYFQLFHSSCVSHLPKKSIYPDGYDATRVDLLFKTYWKYCNRDFIPYFSVMHLGHCCRNWKGRVTPRWVATKML
jgi:hypothetical protein